VLLVLAAACFASPKGLDADPSELSACKCPTCVIALSPKGDWAVACQAREDSDGDGQLRTRFDQHGHAVGDALRLYLVSAGQAPVPIDRYVDSGVSGTYVADSRNGRLELRNMDDGKVVVLSPKLGPRPRLPGWGRTDTHVLYFSPRGDCCLYIDGAVPMAKRRLVLRDLVSGAERQVAVPRGVPWRAQFDRSGSWIIAEVLRDTNGDGRLEPPMPDISEIGILGACGGWVGAPRVARNTDKTTQCVGAVGTLAVAEREDVVGVDGSLLVTRQADGTTRIRDAEANWEAALPAGRDLVLVSASEHSFVSSQRRGESSTTWWQKGPTVRKLGSFPGVGAAESITTSRWAQLPGAWDLFVNMVTGDCRRIPPGHVMWFNSQCVLVAHKQRAVLVDLATGKEQDAGRASDVLRRPATGRGNLVAWEGQLLDLGDPFGRWRFEGVPLGISGDGRVLVGEPSTDDSLPRGPLHWVIPRRVH
jgi:hypothetical protein